jgi:hypothetical protein
VEMENALGLLKEVCEDHGARCYLVAYDTISTALAEALKPSHNSAMDEIADTLSCLCDKWVDYSDSERQALIVTSCQQLRQ